MRRSSARLIVCTRLASSWKPSSRLRSTSSVRLTFAYARYSTSDAPEQAHPRGDVDRLGPAARFDARALQNVDGLCLRDRETIRERVGDSFPRLFEARVHKPGEAFEFVAPKRPLGVFEWFEHQDRGVYLWPRVERGAGNAAEHADARLHLDQHGESAPN